MSKEGENTTMYKEGENTTMYKEWENTTMYKEGENHRKPQICRRSSYQLGYRSTGENLSNATPDYFFSPSISMDLGSYKMAKDSKSA